MEEAQADLEKRQTEAREKEAHLAETSRRESELAEMVQDLRTALAVEKRAEESLRQQKSPMARRLEELRLLSERRGAEITHYEDKIAAAEAESAELTRSATEADVPLVFSFIKPIDSSEIGGREPAYDTVKNTGR